MLLMVQKYKYYFINLQVNKLNKHNKLDWWYGLILIYT